MTCGISNMSGSTSPGKSLFLIFLIVHFLGQKRPIAVQMYFTFPSYTFLGDQGYSIHYIEDSQLLVSQSSSVWVLCDSGDESMIPNRYFMAPNYRDHTRVIQVTPLNASRWKAFSKRYRAERFVMDIFSDDEIRKLA